MKIIEYTPTAYESHQNRVPVSLPAPPWATDAIDITERQKPTHMTAKVTERDARIARITAAIAARPLNEWFSARDIARAIRTDTFKVSGLMRGIAASGLVEVKTESVAGSLTFFYRRKAQ